MKIKKLSMKELNILKQHFQSILFKNHFNLVYERHVPNTAVMLLSGELELLRNNKIQAKIGPGHLLGVNQLINNVPVRLSCKVKENSEFIILQKSEILAVIQDHGPPLHLIITADEID